VFSIWHLFFGAAGGAIEAPVRSVLDTIKSKTILDNVGTLTAAERICKEKGMGGFFPYMANTTGIRALQRGGLYCLANSDASVATKTGLGFVYELVVTSVNQAITVNAADNNPDLAKNPLRFVYHQYEKHGVKGVVSPWTAARNLTFLGLYNVGMRHRQEERKVNPLRTSMEIALVSTLGSHVFDPVATYHTRFPGLPTVEVPKQFIKEFGWRAFLTKGVDTRLGSVGVGVGVYNTVADTIKNWMNSSNGSC
jgi:hypothetical protein